MRRVVTYVCWIYVSLGAAAAVGAAPGAVVAVGGGGTTPAIVARTLDLAGGGDAIVAVLPQASAADGAGDGAVKQWRDAGARDVYKVDIVNRAAAREAIERATLIWIPGGDQNRFMKAIDGTGLVELIRARHHAGAVVGGTSAGAAVLSAVMITGDADLQSLASARTITAAGLALLPDLIVDQHFLRRQRHNRLISLVLDRPALVGVGIDEGTAVVVHGTMLEVLGRSAAVVFDARKASVGKAAQGQVSSGIGMTMHVLRDGMSLDLAR